MPFPIAIECVDAPDVSDWAETCQITGIDFRVNDLQLWHTKQGTGPGAWPAPQVPGFGNVAAGDPGTIQWTLWPVIQVDGAWVTTGCIEFWSGRTNVGGPFSRAAVDWYYFSDRMKGHQPVAGDRVGFFVTNGDQRRKDVEGVQERSAVVWLTVPQNDTGTFHFDTPQPAPVLVPPTPVIPDPPVVVVPPVPVVPIPPPQVIPVSQLAPLLASVVKAFQAVNTKLDNCATHADVAALVTQAQAIVAALTPVAGAPPLPPTVAPAGQSTGDLLKTLTTLGGLFAKK